MIIKKNTNHYKGLRNLIYDYAKNSLRKKSIKLFIVASSKSIQDMISIQELKKDQDFYYELNYNSIIQSFDDNNYQLYQSEDHESLYYFKNKSNKNWDQTPFEISANLEKKVEIYATVIIPFPLEKSINGFPENQIVEQKNIPEKKEDIIQKSKSQKTESSDKKTEFQNKLTVKTKDKEKVNNLPVSKIKTKVGWISVDSEGITSLKYNETYKVLYIKYKSNEALYAYYNVPKNIFNKLLKEEHKTTYVNKKIKKDFEYDALI